MWPIPRRSVIYNDAPAASSSGSAAASAVSSVRSALAAPQSETSRWRKTFDTYAKTDGETKCVSSPLLPRATRAKTPRRTLVDDSSSS